MEIKSRSQEPDPDPCDAATEGLPRTFPQLVRRAGERFGDRTFLPRRHSRGGGSATFRELARDARRAAAGLAARGIAHGDRVGLLSENRYEWLVADLGITSLGAIDVPRGVDTAPSEMHFILEHSGCRFVFVENDNVAAELQDYLKDNPAIEGIGTLQAETEVEGVITFPELLAEGDRWLEHHAAEVDAAAEAVQPEDILTIVYTSGTTADPKGVMLTHDNILSNACAVNQALKFDERDRFLSVLPPWHAYERIMDYVAVLVGAEMVYTDRRRIKDDLAAESPTLFAAVPRIWESIYDGFSVKVQKLPKRRRAVMRFVIRSCRRHGAGQPSVVDRLLRPLVAATVLKKFRGVTGGRLRIAVSGGGALPEHVDQTLLGMGLPLVNGYGLTETSPVVSARRPESNSWGTIGTPIPRMRVEIRDDEGRVLPHGDTGVIWIHGPGVMKGYYRNPERTSAILVDGWFNSGDLGRIEPDGQIRITGRAKDTIVLAGGENVEPERVETAMKVSTFIDQAVVVGQDEKALGALIVVSTEALEHELPRDRWQMEGPAIRSDEARVLIRGELDKLLNRANGFRNVERIATFELIAEPMTPENGFLTQTLKVKRHVVAEHYGDLIAGLFK